MTPVPHRRPVFRTDGAACPTGIPRRPWWRLAIAAIVVLAAALRLVALDRFPPGLHFDEAVYGLMGMDIVRGARPVFFSAYTGREPLYMYLMAGILAALGPTAYAVRLTSALIGIVTVPLTYALGRALYGRRTGIVAAALLAVHFWYLVVSRNGYPNILIPPLEAASAFFLWRAWRADDARWRDWIAGGACAGLVLYTYLAARFWPVFLVVFAVWTLVAAPSRFRRRLAGMATAVAAAAVVVAPLAVHFARQPADFLERANQVLAWRQLHGRDLVDAYVRNILQTAGAFLGQGDPRWHYNLPGRPIFEPVVGLFFLIGLAVCLRRLRDVRFALSLLWIAVMCVPGILTLEMQPAGQRIFGVFPALVLVPAIGLVASGELVSRLAARLRARRARRPALEGQVARPQDLRRLGLPLGTTAILALVVVGADGARTVRDYFLDWVRQPETWHIFNADYAALAEHARTDIAGGRTVVLLSEHYKHPTLAFLASETVDRAIWADPRLALPIPADRGGGDGGPVVYYRLTSVLPDGAPAAEWLETHATRQERFAAPYDPVYVAGRGAPPVDIVRYEVPRGASFSGHAAVAGLGGEVVVPAVTVLDPAERDEPLVIPVDWSVARRPTAGRAFALHLRDADGRTWSQADQTGYLSEQWRPGDWVRQWFTLELDPTTPPGEYKAHLIVSDERGRPLPADRSPAGESSVPVATVRLTPQGERTAEASAEPRAVLGGGLAILSADRIDVTCAPGSTVDVRVLWARWGDLAPAEVTFYLDAEGVDRDVASVVVARDYPPDRWSPREELTGRYSITVPGDLADGDYQLAVRPAAGGGATGAIDKENAGGVGDDRFVLGTIHVAPDR
jgi:4-amino-4-deoxy-L-arabinose transferase-like glycosyltransferase